MQIPAGVVGEFSFPEKLSGCLIWYPFHPPMLPQWYVKDPSHYGKSAGGRLHLNMHTPLAQQFRSVGTYLETSSCNLSGNTRPWSQLTEPPWTDPGLKSGISVHELISTLKKQKVQAGNELLNILSKSLQVRKKSPPTFWE